MAQVIDALTRKSEGGSQHRLHQGRRRVLAKIAAIGCGRGRRLTTDLGGRARQWTDASRCRAPRSVRIVRPAETLRAETLRVLDSYGSGPGHVFT